MNFGNEHYLETAVPNGTILWTGDQTGTASRGTEQPVKRKVTSLKPVWPEMVARRKGHAGEGSFPLAIWKSYKSLGRHSIQRTLEERRITILEVFLGWRPGHELGGFEWAEFLNKSRKGETRYWRKEGRRVNVVKVK